MDNYYIENKETGKIELHFEKSAYLALTEDQKKEIKSNFLFSRYSSAWVSRCKFPNTSYALRVAESLGLENAGTTGDKLTFAEQMEVKAMKAENRADKYEYKAMQAEKKAEQLQKPINDMHGDIAFFTQPNMNTSAGRAFTRKRDRMWNSYKAGMEEFRKSEYYAQRAETARKSTETPTIDFCQRRIDEAQASIRKLNKSIDTYNNYLEQIKAGKEEITNEYGWKVNVNEESILSNIDRWEEIREDALSKIAYYDALIQAQGGIQFNKDNIKVGYIVKLRTSWKGLVLVTSTGPKNIRYKNIDGSGFELQANYSEIIEIVKAAEPTKKHPFEVGEKFTVKAWNGNNYIDKEYEITKVTIDKVTVKSGSERAKAITPRQSYDGKSYYLYVTDSPHGYYAKAI